MKKLLLVIVFALAISRVEAAYNLSDTGGTVTYGTGNVNQCFLSNSGPYLANTSITFATGVAHRWEFSVKTSASSTQVALGNAQDVYVGMNPSGQIYISGNSGAGVTVTSTVTANNNAWHTGYVTFGPSGYSICIDGETPVTDATAYASGGLGNVNPGFQVGDFSASGAHFPWSGSIDEVTVKQGGVTVALYHLDNNGTDSAPSAVADPTFSPVAGSYGSAQSVTISTTTSGASIRYTVDGSTPTNSTGTVYSSAVSISTTTTLKAIAYNGVLADSGVTTGVYTISGPITPVITNIDLTNGGLTGVTVHIATPSAGTPSYTYQWHRSTTVNFTAGVGTAISGATSQSYTDTSMAPGTWYYFRVVVTGSDGASVTSYVRPAQTLGPSISIGYIGDSTGTAATFNDNLAIADRVGRGLRASNRSRIVTITNRSVGGTQTSDWVSGSSNMTSALSAFSAASVTHVFVRLGMNDAQLGASSITTNLQNIVTTLRAAGYIVLVSEPNYREPGSHAPTNAGVTFDESTTPLLISYRTNIASVVAATPGCYFGDRDAFLLTAQRGVEMLYDRIHPNGLGCEAMAQLDLKALRAVLGETASGFIGP